MQKECPTPEGRWIACFVGLDNRAVARAAEDRGKLRNLCKLRGVVLEFRRNLVGSHTPYRGRFRHGVRSRRPEVLDAPIGDEPDDERELDGNEADEVGADGSPAPLEAIPQGSSLNGVRIDLAGTRDYPRTRHERR